MSLKTKTGAVLLALFLGDFGAHWFYLGQSSRGLFYLLGWPCAFVLAIFANVTAFFGIVAFLGMFCLVGCRIYDLFYLIAMHPEEFERDFNGRHVPWSW